MLCVVTQFTKTIICQSHLCPLPLHVAPVYWTYDFTLRMYPLPDVIVCADKYDPFTSTQVECTVTNPVLRNYFLLRPFLSRVHSVLEKTSKVLENSSGLPTLPRPRRSWD